MTFYKWQQQAPTADTYGQTRYYYGTLKVYGDCVSSQHQPEEPERKASVRSGRAEFTWCFTSTETMRLIGDGYADVKDRAYRFYPEQCPCPCEW